jgi:hypothetical protein
MTPATPAIEKDVMALLLDEAGLGAAYTALAPNAVRRRMVKKMTALFVVFRLIPPKTAIRPEKRKPFLHSLKGA